MIALRITLDTKAVAAQLSALHQRQLPFAASLAVNRVGLRFQQLERERLSRVFTLRRESFIHREGVKRLGPAATTNSPTVTFGVSERADFLTRFEKGEKKRPREGRSLAIPVAVRRNRADIVTSGQRPRALFERFGERKGAGSVFIVRQPARGLTKGIFQRTGRKGRGGLRFLYGLADTVPTDPVLEFEKTARLVAEREWPKIFNDALAEAIAKAK